MYSGPRVFSGTSPKANASEAPTATHVTHMPSIHHTLPAVTTPPHACAEEECAICFEAMSEGTAVTMPGCTHKFHGQCLVAEHAG